MPLPIIPSPGGNHRLFTNSVFTSHTIPWRQSSSVYEQCLYLSYHPLAAIIVCLRTVSLPLIPSPGGNHRLFTNSVFTYHTIPWRQSSSVYEQCLYLSYHPLAAIIVCLRTVSLPLIPSPGGNHRLFTNSAFTSHTIPWRQSSSVYARGRRPLLRSCVGPPLPTYTHQRIKQCRSTRYTTYIRVGMKARHSTHYQFTSYTNYSMDKKETGVLNAHVMNNIQ